jgi:hypothetical protein
MKKHHKATKAQRFVLFKFSYQLNQIFHRDFVSLWEENLSVNKYEKEALQCCL